MKDLRRGLSGLQEGGLADLALNVLGGGVLITMVSGIVRCTLYLGFIEPCEDVPP